MLGFLALLGVVVAGFAAAPVWTVAVAAIALASISCAENYQIYRRGQEIGLGELVQGVMLRSFASGLCASALAYGGGFVLRQV
jgi:hypothetical protein